MTDSKPVYLDYNATTPLAPEVVEAVTSALAAWGNPSSGYQTGREARARVEAARAQVAEMVGAPADVGDARRAQRPSTLVKLLGEPPHGVAVWLEIFAVANQLHWVYQRGCHGNVRQCNAVAD